MLIFTGVLLAITTGASIEYYRHLRRIRREYEKAKEVVEDVILSFNRELKREAEKLELVAYRVEAFSSKSGKALEKAEELEKKLQVFEPKIAAVFEEEKKTLAKLEEIEGKVRDVATSQETLFTKIGSLEEHIRQFSTVPETQVEAVIPIKREKALAPLTETELSVLETLATEGPKTAPEIKDKIKLSREHTARLMKKLYEGGYLERDSNKIPFRYSVKKEMEELLRRPKTETA